MGDASRRLDWNGPALKPRVRIQQRASLVPAAAVIPALRENLKIVAVKKLVVALLVSCARAGGESRAAAVRRPMWPGRRRGRKFATAPPGRVTVNKMNCSKQAFRLNNSHGMTTPSTPRRPFVGSLEPQRWLNRNSLGVFVLGS